MKEMMILPTHWGTSVWPFFQQLHKFCSWVIYFGQQNIYCIFFKYWFYMGEKVTRQFMIFGKKIALYYS